MGNADPYQVPPVVLGSFYVEGKTLVVSADSVLPPFCVKTNSPVSEREMVTKRYDWCSPWVALSILVSGMILFLLYFALRKNCILTYGLHSSFRKKYRNRLIYKTLAAIGLFGGSLFVAVIDSPPEIILGVFVLFIASVVFALTGIGSSELRVTRYRKGQFWIKGCCQEFLDRLRAPAL